MRGNAVEDQGPGALRISKELKTLGSPTPFSRLPQTPRVPLSYLGPHPRAITHTLLILRAPASPQTPHAHSPTWRLAAGTPSPRRWSPGPPQPPPHVHSQASKAYRLTRRWGQGPDREGSPPGEAAPQGGAGAAPGTPPRGPGGGRGPVPGGRRTPRAWGRGAGRGGERGSRGHRPPPGRAAPLRPPALPAPQPPRFPAAAGCKAQAPAGGRRRGRRGLAGAGPRPGGWGQGRGLGRWAGPRAVGGTQGNGSSLGLPGCRRPLKLTRPETGPETDLEGLGSRGRLKALHVPRTLPPHACPPLHHHFYLYFFILTPLRGTSQGITGTTAPLLHPGPDPGKSDGGRWGKWLTNSNSMYRWNN